jgi:hypothetical protein
MIKKTDDIKLAYLGGLFEGEGSAMIQKGTKNGKDIYTCKLKLQMTDGEPVRLLYDVLGGHLEIAKQRSSGNQRELLMWWVSGKKAGEVAEQLLPLSLWAMVDGFA